MCFKLPYVLRTEVEDKNLHIKLYFCSFIYSFVIQQILIINNVPDTVVSAGNTVMSKT